MKGEYDRRVAGTMWYYLRSNIASDLVGVAGQVCAVLRGRLLRLGRREHTSQVKEKTCDTNPTPFTRPPHLFCRLSVDALEEKILAVFISVCGHEGVCQCVVFELDHPTSRDRL